ncbi:TetR/AcrR family transcriptional regulator [Breoghania sp.]|uniref:TetR/AcrR family transcriptional regulator n=1 Tax=Breoghania sp. TaxID=2065378 RepID=UPI0026397F39|nr:TetR/AcrR family transcriptional regulator [Breoghania sp.]MDJ0931969.1 TetR/AcrR family transcriptional regulator [Breoghania sp.]
MHSVLDAALRLFWENGFEATSVDALTAAMGMSKSSFYGAFGSKQGVLLAALQCYSDEVYAGWVRLAEEAGEGAPTALVHALARPECGSRGCLFANIVSERGPHDDEVADLGRRHFARVETLLAGCLVGDAPEDAPLTARDRARALMALAFGAMILRKSGVVEDDIERALAQAERLIGER